MLDWKTESFAVIDVETTGLSSKDDRVIELGICHVSCMEVVSVESYLINPMRELRPIITEITGIKPEDLISCAPFKDQADLLYKKLPYHILGAFNVGFDRPFVENEFRRAGINFDVTYWLDPLIWVRHYEEWEVSRKLGEVANRLDIKVEGNAHRAGADAEMAARIILHYGEDMPDDLVSLIAVQGMWKRQQDAKRADKRNHGKE